MSELSNPRVQDVEGLEWREWHVKFMKRKFARLRSFRACKIEHLMALRGLEAAFRFLSDTWANLNPPSTYYIGP